MPCPYENPVLPSGASTLPRTDYRMRSNGSDEGVQIPPPPSHAPPPLTQSSLELFARSSRSPPHSSNGNSSHHRHQPMEQQHGMSHRSHSTSQTSPPPLNNMRPFRSAGQLHPLESMPEEMSSQDNGPEYATIYPDERVMSRQQLPPHHRNIHHSPPGLPPPSFNHNSSVITPPTNSDRAFFPELDQGHRMQLAHMPMAPPPQHIPREDSMEAGFHGQRVSLFSETSTEEPSISGDSMKEMPLPSEFCKYYNNYYI